MAHRRSKLQPAPPPTAPGVPGQPASQRPQFSILGMFVVMLSCSVTFAGAYYLVRADGEDTTTTLVALLFLLSSPMLLVVAVSLVIWVTGWFSKR